MQKRGFSLVELSIVIVIMMILSSYLAANYFTVSQARGEQEVRGRMDQINEAILNYAAAHKTGGRDVEVINNRVTTPPSPPVRVRWRLPSGRPYLPCPDITGDGYEDRIPPTPNAITVDINRDRNLAVGLYPLETTGGCHSDRGALPWRTLDVPELDSWGNRFTYRVMPAFSNALTGFDQHARADTVPYRPLMTLAATIVRPVTSSIQQADATYSNASPPSPWTGNLMIHQGPSLICDDAPCPDSNSETIVGTVFAADSPSPGVELANFADFNGVVLANFPTGSAADGVPFVVVSHGRNGYGAIRGGNGEEFYCIPFPPGSRNNTRFLAEKQNALWFTAINLPRRAEGAFSCAMPQGTTDYNGVGFVSVPVHAPADGDQGFDDIVRWLSVEEVVKGLAKRGALPARLLPPIGLEK